MEQAEGGKEGKFVKGYSVGWNAEKESKDKDLNVACRRMTDVIGYYI